MNRRNRIHSFESPSLVPLADMLANTVGIMVFILMFVVLVVVRSVPREHETTKKPLLFVCAHDRLLLLDDQHIKSALRSIVGVPTDDNLADWGHRLEAAHMEVDGFHVQGGAEFLNGVAPDKGIVRLRPLPRSGEDAVRAGSSGSTYLSALKNASPKDRFAFFLVYPDSVDVYHQARNLAEQTGFETGWRPCIPDATLTAVIWTIEVGDKVEFYVVD